MTTTQGRRAEVGWSFWLGWVFASFLGFAVGGVVDGFAGYALDELGVVGMAVFGALFGAGGRAMQWLVMRRHVARAGWWVLATAAGYTLAGIVAGSIFRLPSPAVTFAAAVAFGVVAGAAGGTMQWLVLRRQVGRAGWWVLASILGLAVGLGAGAPVALTLGQAGRAIESTAVFGTIFGVGVGAIPGAALVWLLRQPVRESTHVMATAP